jgi:guanosine-3',5'-bis(diphosphate) 3'-pyrophosphohydrolase
MKKPLEAEFKKALRMLEQHLPPADDNAKKPVLSHAIRVGKYLKQGDYSQDVILAGLLHDALEFSSLTEEIIQSEFGENVLKIVKACTKDRSIKDPEGRIDELTARAAEAGKESLIVRAADTIDSFRHYTKTNNQKELEYCRQNAQAIVKHLPDSMKDPIFEKLSRW